MPQVEQEEVWSYEVYWGMKQGRGSNWEIVKWTDPEIVNHNAWHVETIREHNFIESVFIDPKLYQENAEKKKASIAAGKEATNLLQKYPTENPIQVLFHNKVVPAGATHIVVLSKSQYGEAVDKSVSCLFRDYVEDEEVVMKRELEQMDK